MNIGDLVWAPVNDGELKQAQVIGVYGDIIVVAGPDEQAIAREKGRSPVGVGFYRTILKESKEGAERY